METPTKKNNQPTHIVKTRQGYGKQTSYERIGVAWLNDEQGSLYVKLHGTQIIEDGFSLYPIQDEPAPSQGAPVASQ